MSRILRPVHSTVALATLVAAMLLGGRARPAIAQSAPSADERIKALESERDELKKCNGVLELRLKQLQATVNKQITEALEGSPAGQATTQPPVPHPPGEPVSTAAPFSPPVSYLQTAPWRSLGPAYTRSAGVFSPLQSPLDLVSLAVAYQDAIGELQRVRQAKDSKESHPNVGVEAAESKVRLLRSMTKTMRDQLAEEVDRMHKLDAVHAVPIMDVHNLDAKLRIVDLILSHDPEAERASSAPVSAKSAGDKPTK
jgi:hypothetical protein